MNLNFFDQFLSPIFLGIPLIFMALIFPLLLLPPITTQWVGNRTQSLYLWFSHTFTKQLMLPLNIINFTWPLMLMALMFLLISINLLGLLPYTFTPTTQLSMNLGLAIPLWLATILMGMRNKTTKALGHLLPEGTPTLLIPILIMIETVSLFIRPLALGVRLTANLTAGHLLIQLVSTATITLLSSMPTIAMLTTTLLFMLTLLEIAVAVIQAYVFVLLLSLYLQENV